MRKRKVDLIIKKKKTLRTKLLFVEHYVSLKNTVLQNKKKRKEKEK